MSKPQNPDPRDRKTPEPLNKPGAVASGNDNTNTDGEKIIIPPTTSGDRQILTEEINPDIPD